MLTTRQNHIAYEALLNMLKASGVIVKDAQPDWPMLIHIANEYVDHLNQVKDKPAVEPMDPEQVYLCETGLNDDLVVYPQEVDPRQPQIIVFLCECKSSHGTHQGSVHLSMDNIRRLRDQLNQFLGE